MYKRIKNLDFDFRYFSVSVRGRVFCVFFFPGSEGSLRGARKSSGA